MAPKARHFYTLALALAATGRDDAARSAVRAGLRLEPNHPQLNEALQQLGGTS